jgi:hypothetical protein
MSLERRFAEGFPTGLSCPTARPFCRREIARFERRARECVGGGLVDKGEVFSQYRSLDRFYQRFSRL